MPPLLNTPLPCSTKLLATGAGIVKNLQWNVEPTSEIIMITAQSERLAHYNRWRSMGKIKTHVKRDIINYQAEL